MCVLRQTTVLLLVTGNLIMTKQSYEMIEGQVGGALGGGAAVAREEGGSLLPEAKSLRKAWVAACVGAVLAVALLAACVSASPGVSARDASGMYICTDLRFVNEQDYVTANHE